MGARAQPKEDVRRLAAIERRLQKLAQNPAEAVVARALSRYDKHPVAYVEHHLRGVLTPQQREILEKLDTAPYRVLARSANTQGKTFIGAAKCSHHFDSAQPSITLVTAPTRDSVRDLAFKELRQQRSATPAGLRGFYPKDTRLEAAPNHFVHGYTAANPDAFQGRHAERLGLWFDEATGVERPFWMRGETMFESNGLHWWLCTYNPNDSTSPAYAAEESETWHVVRLNALEHPNILAEVRGDAPPIPGAVRLATIIRRMAAEVEIVTGEPDAAVDFEFPAGSGCWWHPKTPDFEAQILGRWPAVPAAALFSPVLVERCYANAIDVDPRWQITAGCDVARFGDDKTVIAVRCGPCLLGLWVYSGLRTGAIAEAIRSILKQLLRRLGLDPEASTSVPVFVDDSGGWGAGVIDQANGFNFIGVNAGSQSIDPRYLRTRSFLWCNLATLADGGALDFSRLDHDDRRLVKQELTAARYRIDVMNRREMLPKQDVKERLGRSPDRADAICLAYYGAAAIAT